MVAFIADRSASAEREASLIAEVPQRFSSLFRTVGVGGH